MRVSILSTPGQHPEGQVWLDERRVEPRSVRSISFTHEAASLPVVELGLAFASTVDLRADDAEVRVDPQTAALLERLGWQRETSEPSSSAERDGSRASVSASVVEVFEERDAARRTLEQLCWAASDLPRLLREVAEHGLLARSTRSLIAEHAERVEAYLEAAAVVVGSYSSSWSSSSATCAWTGASVDGHVCEPS